MKLYSRCRRQIHFVNASPECYQMAKHHSTKQVYLHTLKIIQICHGCKSEIFGTHHAQSFEIYCITVVEAHDKLRHQGVTHTYCLIKHQYFWKGMNRDIWKYIASCTLCQREKAKVQLYPLQMTEILERLFDKIIIDLVTECVISTSGNKHTDIIIDHRMAGSFYNTGWICRTIVSTFINYYLPVHMCPRYILSDNGTEFMNQLMDQVLQQLRIDHIFSPSYHPQNGKLEVFHKYLKPTLKKLCEKDPTNWDK